MIEINSTLVVKLCFVGILGCIFMTKRIFDTYMFRMTVLDTVSALARVDIENRKPWEWRFDTYVSVPFPRLVWMFWRPLTVEEWWEDTSFVEETKNG